MEGANLGINIRNRMDIDCSQCCPRSCLSRKCVESSDSSDVEIVEIQSKSVEERTEKVAQGAVRGTPSNKVGGPKCVIL